MTTRKHMMPFVLLPFIAASLFSCGEPKDSEASQKMATESVPLSSFVKKNLSDLKKAEVRGIEHPNESLPTYEVKEADLENFGKEILAIQVTPNENNEAYKITGEVNIKLIYQDEYEVGISAFTMHADHDIHNYNIDTGGIDGELMDVIFQYIPEAKESFHC